MEHEYRVNYQIQYAYFRESKSISHTCFHDFNIKVLGIIDALFSEVVVDRRMSPFYRQYVAYLKWYMIQKNITNEQKIKILK